MTLFDLGTKAEKAQRLAAALTETTERYTDGMMKYPTWREHVVGLWARARAAGVEDEVAELVTSPMTLACRLVVRGRA